eukprot:g40558.t1
MGGFEKWIEKTQLIMDGVQTHGSNGDWAGLLTLLADLAPFIKMSGPLLWIPSLIAICLGGAAWFVWKQMEAKRSKEDKFNTNLYDALKQLEENLKNEADVKSLLKQLQHLKGVSTTRWEGVAPTVLNSDDRYSVGECPICLDRMLCCSDQKTQRDALLATPADEAQHNAHCKGKHLFHYDCLDPVSPAGDGGLRAGTCPCCRSPYIRIVKLKVGRDGQGREVFD